MSSEAEIPLPAPKSREGRDQPTVTPISGRSGSRELVPDLGRPQYRVPDPALLWASGHAGVVEGEGIGNYLLSLGTLVRGIPPWAVRSLRKRYLNSPASNKGRLPRVLRARK